MQRDPNQPGRMPCSCGEEVLSVMLDGKQVLLEAREVVPQGKCPNCRGQCRVAVSPEVAQIIDCDSVACPECDGTGIFGGLAEAGMVCVDAKGNTRVLPDRDARREGEALHILHAQTCVMNLRRQPQRAEMPDASNPDSTRILGRQSAAAQEPLFEEMAA